MKIKLTNQAHISYARTEDACEAFRRAVGNGQARLALEMMVDIVNYIESLPDIETADPPSAEITSKQAVKEVTKNESPRTAAKKQPAAKAQSSKVEEGTKEED